MRNASQAWSHFFGDPALHWLSQYNLHTFL